LLLFIGKFDAKSAVDSFFHINEESLCFREVIQRRPEDFKIACLRDIKRLWGPGVAPFYAGFGNRITDSLSYRSVEIPPSRIFTIDPTGEIRLDLISSYKSSYIKMNDIVDHIFPAFDPSAPPDHAVESFNDLEYWRSATPHVLITPEELAAGKSSAMDNEARLVKRDKTCDANVLRSGVGGDDALLNMGSEDSYEDEDDELDEGAINDDYDIDDDEEEEEEGEEDDDEDDDNDNSFRIELAKRVPF
jgi:phosphatidate phosphatase LPIN